MTLVVGLAPVDTIELPLAGLRLLCPRVHRDDRGFFIETWSSARHHEAGMGVSWAQDNHSRSLRGTLRGMHFQRSPGQAKLVRCARGKIWDVAVDIRPGSVTFGRWHAELLDDEHHHQLFVPIGFAHGFVVLSEQADVVYKTSSAYDAAAETGFLYCDPAVSIPWPVEPHEIIVSARDRDARSLAEVVA
jgi:dTDP-4-dehydrorhamnose 3,5-epimerase